MSTETTQAAPVREPKFKTVTLTGEQYEKLEDQLRAQDHVINSVNAFFTKLNQTVTIAGDLNLITSGKPYNVSVIKGAKADKVTITISE
jgi:hypothetical protein